MPIYKDSIIYYARQWCHGKIKVTECRVADISNTEESLYVIELERGYNGYKNVVPSIIRTNWDNFVVIPKENLLEEDIELLFSEDYDAVLEEYNIKLYCY